jgi:phospholipase C
VVKRLVAGVGVLAAAAAAVATSPRSEAAPLGIHKIQHVVVIMQENRSFDSYFGTYPGADGIPMHNGHPAVCVPDPATGSCQRPYHDRADVNGGGPHEYHAFRIDVHHGRMDGFLRSAEHARTSCSGAEDPFCGQTKHPDVMGYHDGREIPNYWAYAKNFVLQDHMFEPNSSWSLPAHLFMVSEWSASCGIAFDASSCVNAPNTPRDYTARQLRNQNSAWPAVHYDWTDLTYLMHRAGVSWHYYLDQGAEPDCVDGAMACVPHHQTVGVPGIWNPLPAFDTVHLDGEMSDVVPVSNFYVDAAAGTLPMVSWVVPNGADSEHPPARVSTGQSYVTSLINAVMASPDWSSTAIFLAWDDWGGLYDHVPPPSVDADGYGIRVPGLVISPYAKAGAVDHQMLSFDAYAKFIEDDFLSGQRLDPATDGRPDPRPDVRENTPGLGDLTADFDFNQPPRPPLFLPEDPHTDLTG